MHQRGAQTIAAKLREVGENCRQAWHIALEQRWLAPMNAAVEGWTRYWVMTGRHREGEALLAAALAVLEAPAAASTAPGDEQRLRAKLWLAYAQCLQGQERIKGCLDAAKTAGTLALACDEVACYAKAQALYATGLCLQLRHAEARPFAEQAYQSGIWEAQIDALITLAGYESDIHSHVTVTAQALQIAQQHDDPYLILLCTQHLAGSYENQGYYAHSLSYRKQALELACALQDTYLSGEAHYLYGLVHAHLGLYEGSIEQLQQALALAQQHSVAWLERRTLNRLAYSHYWLGHLDTAYAFAQQVQKMQHQDEELFVFGDFVYAQILDARGQWCDAERIYQQILTHKRAHSARGATTLLPELAALAALALQQGDQRQALCYVEEILVIVATEGGNREGNIFTPPLYFNAYAIDLACYTVLHALGDERAQQVLATGHQRLWAQVEQIAELPLRQSYIENVAANQALYLALA